MLADFIPSLALIIADFFLCYIESDVNISLTLPMVIQFHYYFISKHFLYIVIHIIVPLSYCYWDVVPGM